MTETSLNVRSWTTDFAILGVSEDPKFDVLTSGAGAIQVEA
jgi:hypothetical protein